jgi:hypothetical protein
VYPTGVAGTSALASVGIVGNNIISVTQSAMTSALGSLTVTTHVSIALTGVYGTGAISQILVWGDVVPGQDPEWGVIDDSQSPSWGAIDDSQTPDWQEVA